MLYFTQQTPVGPERGFSLLIIHSKITVQAFKTGSDRQFGTIKTFRDKIAMGHSIHEKFLVHHQYIHLVDKRTL